MRYFEKINLLKSIKRYKRETEIVFMDRQNETIQ